MRYTVSLLLLVACFVMHALVVDAYAAFPWGKSYLLKIDDQEYTPEDFRNWWGNWRDRNQPVPSTVDPYVDWLLMVREGERMMLYDDPVYHRDVNVYLRVLSQVQLKNDEIDSRISITDEMVEKRYREQYLPVWTYHFAAFKDKESAQKAYGDLVAGTVTMEELAKAAQSAQSAPHGATPSGHPDVGSEGNGGGSTGGVEKLLGVQLNAKRRPFRSDKEWSDVLGGLEPGAFAAPFPYQETFVIVQLKDRFAGDADDFAKISGSIRTRLRKEQQAALTFDLLKRLKKKFNVTVNEERLKVMDPDSPETIQPDSILITIGDMQVTERQVIDKVESEFKRNSIYGLTRGDGRETLLRVVDGIIGQTLITLESLDRHYERESPIKELVEFKQKHKLVQKLDRLIREQVPSPGEEEIKAYYAENRSEFAGPEIYRMALLKGDEQTLNRIWLGVVVNGEDFFSIAKKELGDGPSVQGYPADHLEKPVLEQVRSLNRNELSRVFPLDDGYGLVYLVEYVQSKTTPLEMVRERIRKKLLDDAFAEAREAYLADLRKKASLQVNENLWTKLQSELIQEQ
ncbi:MAG: hypothetical protein Kow0089_12750 [Desulfobulbaceae bacterium]